MAAAIVILLWAVYVDDKSTYSKDTYSLVFIENLVTIAKLWSQPRCPSTNKWIWKM
jgi:hypothetical protein